MASSSAAYTVTELMPPGKAMYRITTQNSPVRGTYGADIIAQHGLCVNIPVVREIEPSIRVWETPQGSWWQDQLAQDVSRDDYSVCCFALEHNPKALANPSNTAHIGVAIAQQIFSIVPRRFEGLGRSAQGVTRDLWFFGTSYGGVLLKKAYCVLAKAKDRFVEELAAKATCHINFAVPHRGSHAASVLQANSSILKELKEDSKFLKDLETEFNQLKVARNLRVINFLETHGAFNKVLRTVSFHAEKIHDIIVPNVNHTDVPGLKPGSAEYDVLAAFLQLSLPGQLDVGPGQDVIHGIGIAEYADEVQEMNARLKLVDAGYETIITKSGSLRVVFSREDSKALDTTPFDDAVSVRYYTNGIWTEKKGMSVETSEATHVSAITIYDQKDSTVWILYKSTKDVESLQLAVHEVLCDLSPANSETLAKHPTLSKIADALKAQVYEMPDIDVVNAVLLCGNARPALIPMGSFAMAAAFGNSVLEAAEDSDSEPHEDEEVNY